MSGAKLRWWEATLVLGAAVVLYAPSLNLMLFWDDVPHMLWLDGQSHGAYWLSSAGFPFYRPSTFFIWDLLHGLIGHHDAFVLHLLSVSLHTTNSLLVAVWGAYLVRHHTVGLWAGLMFAFFPFSYQTVVPTAAHFHLMQMMALLLSSWLLLMWLQHRQRWTLFLGWGLAFWGVFCHENGVLFPILSGLLLGIGYVLPLEPGGISVWLKSNKVRRWFVALMPLAIFAGLYGMMWAVVPKANDAAGLQLMAMDVKIAQTSQGVGFPIAYLWRQSVDPINTTIPALASGFIVIAIFIGWLLWMRKRLLYGLGALALLWLLLVMIPAWAFLEVNYLLGSPRLHYIASPAIAWLWGLWLSRPSPIKKWSFFIGAGVGIGILGISGIFIQERIEEHRRLDRLYRNAGEIANNLEDKTDRTPHLLLINGPAYLAPSEPYFLLGSEGATYLPDFINPRDLLGLNGYNSHRSLGVDNRRTNDLMPNTPYVFAMTHPYLDREAVKNYDAVAMVVADDRKLEMRLVGEQLVDQSSSTITADFGNGIILQDIQITSSRRVELVWQVVTDELPPIAVFVHFLCDGVLPKYTDGSSPQADGPPLGKLYPFEWWQIGETWRDYRYVDGDVSCQGERTVFVGLYNPNDGLRYTLADGRDGVLVSVE